MGRQKFDDHETPAGLYFRTIPLVEQDNKHEFVRLFNRLESDYKEWIISEISEISEICFCDTANCLAAILDGEAGDESLITLYLSDVEKNVPLHGAARGATSRIASLLLDKGFSADLRGDFDSPHICLKNALPLNVSIDYSGFLTFCLARNTKAIKHEFFKYLKQGKVFEVGALLAIASDLIMSSSSTTDRENGSIGFKNIMEMRQFLLAEMSRSLGTSDTQLKEIKKTLRLLEIFDRVGDDKLLAHMPMWDNYTSDSGVGVASLIEDAAYDEEEEVEYDHDAVPRAYYNPLQFHHTSSESCSYSIVKNTGVYSVLKSTTYTNEHLRIPSCYEDLSSDVDAPLPKFSITRIFV